MNPPPHPPHATGLKAGWAWFVSAVAVMAFHVAYLVRGAEGAILGFLIALGVLFSLGEPRRAFNYGVLIGLGVYTPHLGFFYNIFGPAAMALWMVLPVWLGLFLALAVFCQTRFGPAAAAALAPFLWTGTEYFRSELYYLKFSWLNIGYLAADAPWGWPINELGMYGVAFALMGLVCGSGWCWRKSRSWGAAAFLLGLAAFYAIGMTHASKPGPTSAGRIEIAGIQMEFPALPEVLARLNDLVRAHPQTELIVLSEYTFDGPVPDRLRAWCRKNRRYLIVGGKATAGSTNFYNTVFVVGPTGEIVFQQVKCVPIQFFQDGLAAPEQRVWPSPWGRLGICVCYDLSYRRVTDALVCQGAQALIVPTMDMEYWGRYQHLLHTRVAPVRATEYGIPIFRLASSGISQLVASTGATLATAPCPGDGAVIAGRLELPAGGHLPLDRHLGPFAAVITVMIALVALADAARRQRKPACLRPSTPPTSHQT